MYSVPLIKPEQRKSTKFQKVQLNIPLVMNKTLLLTGSPMLILHTRGPLFTCIYCETLVLPAVSFFLFLLTGAALTMSEVRTQHSALKNISPSVCTQLVLHPAAASYFYTQEGNKFVLSWLLSRSLRARVRFSVRRCW